MKSFLGAANVYRQFVKGFADIARPLSDMLKKDSGVNWEEDIIPTEEQQKVFEKLKEILSSPPVLALPIPGRPYMIDCDACK